MICNHMSWGNALVKAKTMSQIPLLHNFRRIFCMKPEIQQDQKKFQDCIQPYSSRCTAYLHTNHAWVETGCVMGHGTREEDYQYYKLFSRGFGSDSHMVGNNTVELNLGMRSTCIGVTRRLRRPPRCVQDTRNDYPS